MAVVMSACSQPDWCESESAEALRARNVTALPYATVHELLSVGPDDPIALFAHRGGIDCAERDGAPENSISNVKKAIRMGFDGYETDLWTTVDGEFLINHDHTLDRSTTGTGEVAAITFAESRGLRLKYPSGNVSTEQMPTLRELLTAGQGRILFLVELKGGSAERFTDLISIAREAGALDHVLFWIDWTAERATLFEQHLNSGIQEVRTNVMWRARSLQALEDIVQRFDPIMVDLPPSYFELRWQRRLNLFPKKHLALVDTAHKLGVKVLVSKVTKNSHVDVLQSKGVRVFMSRAPEVQLTYLIANGLHH